MPNVIKYPVINGVKECGSCRLNLPVTEFHKAKNHYTSRCKSCIKDYLRQYRSRPDVKEQMRDYHINYKRNPVNRKKINDRIRQWRKTEKGRITRNNNRKSWTLNEKRKAIKYKGGKCVVCGYSKCEAAMEFHHIDSKNKIGIKDHWSFERSKNELDKCVLLCCRCHREVHAKLIKL